MYTYEEKNVKGPVEMAQKLNFQIIRICLA